MDYRSRKFVIILNEFEVVDYPLSSFGSHLHKGKVIAVARMTEIGFISGPLTVYLHNRRLNGIGCVGIVKFDMDFCQSIVFSEVPRTKTHGEVTAVQADIGIRRADISLNSLRSEPVTLLKAHHSESTAGLMQTSATPLPAAGERSVDLARSAQFVGRGLGLRTISQRIEIFRKHGNELALRISFHCPRH